MSNILVTGAAGFIGAQLVHSLTLHGRKKVISVDKRSHFAERFSEHNFAGYGEIVDRDELFSWLETAKPELSAIFHIGACASTTEFDVEFLKRNNVEYSQKLWTYATKHKIPFFYASSAATYGDGEQGYDDDESKIHLLKPLNPYGDSKHQFDLWALAEEKKGSTPPAWAGFKFFNVYGLGERHKKKMSSVVLQAFDQISAHGAMKLFKSHRAGIGDGEQKRDFIQVWDVVKVLRFAEGGGITRGIYNLGIGKARSFFDLARTVFKTLALPENISFIDTPIEIRDKYQYFTEAKMQKLIKAGYADRFLSLEVGVREYCLQLKAHAK